MCMIHIIYNIIYVYVYVYTDKYYIYHILHIKYVDSSIIVGNGKFKI